MALNDVQSVSVKLTPGSGNIPQESATPFECTQCKASARFRPLYRFNESGVRPEILMQAPGAMQCGNCGQSYAWVPPGEGLRNGGWVRISLLEDAEDAARG